jgi:hypothetical protein
MVAIPANPMMPRFCQHIEYKLGIGAAPFSGASRSKTGGWLAFRELLCTDAFAIQVALLDAWWPSMVLRMKKMRAMGTVSFSCHFLEPIMPPYIFVAHTHTLKDGFATESNWLWSEQGVLVARAQQLIAIL